MQALSPAEREQLCDYCGVAGSSTRKHGWTSQRGSASLLQRTTREPDPTAAAATIIAYGDSASIHVDTCG